MPSGVCSADRVRNFLSGSRSIGDIDRGVTEISTRVCVVPVAIDREGRVLLVKMARNRGVFPGQWALPGGGVEPGERILDALAREVREELGIELASAEPLLFKDAVVEKVRADGSRTTMHAVFLVYRCVPGSYAITINEEFSEYGWFDRTQLAAIELPEMTAETLRSAGLL